jgi:hypothetical protein
MAHPRTTSATPEQLKERTRKLFAHSPLNSFIPLMEETITSVAGTTDPSGQPGVAALVRLLDYYERFFSKSFGPRFDLDASLKGVKPWIHNDNTSHATCLVRTARIPSSGLTLFQGWKSFSRSSRHHLPPEPKRHPQQAGQQTTAKRVSRPTCTRRPPTSPPETVTGQNLQFRQ